MKTVSQIERKISMLKRRLSGKRVRENFGDKEQRELDEFIGDIYSQANRLFILGLRDNFIAWCQTYTGEKK